MGNSQADILHSNRDRIIFVVGSSRSGTTMMGHLIGNHSSIFTSREFHFFEELWSPTDSHRILSKKEALTLSGRLLSIYHNGYLFRKNPKHYFAEAEDIIRDIQSEVVSSQIYKTFLTYAAMKNNKIIACDHSPRNVFYIEEILNLYPDARIINMVRDPRDVLLSQKKRWKLRFLGGKKGISMKETVRSWVNYNPITISILWKAASNAAGRFADESRVCSIYFEELLKEPEKTVQKLCDFLEIPFTRDLLEVQQKGSSHNSNRPEKKGIDSKRTGRWEKGELTSAELYLCQKITKTAMELHGYQPVQIHPHPLKLIYSIVSLPVKLIFSFVLNLEKMKNITETIKRRLK